MAIRDQALRETAPEISSTAVDTHYFFNSLNTKMAAIQVLDFPISVTPLLPVLMLLGEVQVWLSTRSKMVVL